MNTSAPRAQILDRLRRQAADPGRRVLLTGAAVVTMDPRLGTLPKADLLIQGETIAAIGPGLAAQGAADGAVVIDAHGFILAPGFVDTHRHAWEAQLRRIMPDVDDLGDYVTSTLAGLAPAYTPHDVYVGTRLAALTALDGGITTLLDFSHNSRSAAHSDSAIQALADTGIRGVHASMRPHFGDWDGQWPGDLARLKDKYFSTDDRLLTLRMATLATDEIAGPDLAYGPGLARTARELGIGVSVDAVFGAPSSAAVMEWEKAGLLGPDVSLIHCTNLTADAWRAMGATGTNVALAPTSDAQIGLETAVPAIDEALAAGIRPGLSIDVEVALASDMFTQMRALLAIQRMRAVDAAYATEARPQRIGVADVLDLATASGARSIGLGDTTGSLTPGKQADLLLVGAEDLNTMPLNDPVGTLVLGADPRNIDAVFVAGNPRKWAGTVLDVDVTALGDEVRASRDNVLRAAGRA
ncbi:amidohydrolase family protein [Actinomadura sp. 21ATH]|uniref:amidohydrolase family protein n=1 Tax=Actinomadura sp. 21ATH TaxID=1735444 RepID=UPI0035C24F8E